MTITAGQRHDISEAPDLLPYARGRYLIADGSYDSAEVRELIADLGLKAVIHRNRRRSLSLSPLKQPSKKLYRLRGQIECFFHRLKRFRAIATRYDKSATHFLAAIHVACAVLWLSG